MENSIPFIMIVAVFILAVVMAIMLCGLSRISIMELQEYDSWSEPFGYAILITFTLLVLSFFQIQIVDGPIRVFINLTGVVIPVALCFYLVLRSRVRIKQALLSAALVALTVFPLVSIINGAMILNFPLWLLPVACAVACAFYFAKDDSVADRVSLAYFGATMGIFCGGDVVNAAWLTLPSRGEIQLGANGLLDFVFLMGIMAVAVVGVIAYAPSAMRRLLQDSRGLLGS